MHEIQGVVDLLRYLTDVLFAHALWDMPLLVNMYK